MAVGWLWVSAVIGAVAAGIVLNTVIVDHQTRAGAPRDGGHLIDIGGLAANVKVVGAGPAIVLIHGFGAAIDWWDAIEPRLSSKHRMVMIDLIGHGGTAAPRSGYSIERQAALVAATITEFGIDRAVVIGHSMGAEVATAIAEAYPDRVIALVLIDPSSTADTQFNVLTELYLTPVIGELLAHFQHKKALRMALEQGFAPGFKIPNNFIDDLRQVTYNALHSAHRESIAYRKAKSLSARLAATRPKPPLLAIFGARDPIVPPNSAALLAQVPGSKIATLPGVGHSPMVEAPVVTADLIEAFLSEQK
jgi:pimeloyl-ACP methyl ester carboxylesterase